MKDGAFAIFGGGKKTFEFRNLSDVELGQRFCCGAKRYRAHRQINFSALSCFDLC